MIRPWPSALADNMGDTRLRREVRQCLLEVIASTSPELAQALVSDDLAFTAIGMDSIQATEISCVIAEAHLLNVPSTVAFEHPTLERLTDYVVRALVAHALNARASSDRRVAGRAFTLDDYRAGLPAST